jgi:SulP family sulfate permease
MKEPLPADGSSPRAAWRRPAVLAAGALGAALAQAPLDAAYGLVALAPLGIAAQAMALALLGSALANGVACVAGGGRLVGGPRPATALLTLALVTSLLGEPALRGADGRVDALLIVMLVAIGLAAAAALQLLFGALRVGALVKYTPHPVRQGLTSGVGFLLILSGLPVLLGLGFGAGWAALPHGASLPSVGWLVGLVALAVTLLATRFKSRLPAVLAGLLCATLVQFLLGPVLPATAFGPTMGRPEWPLDWLPALGQAQAQVSMLLTASPLAVPLALSLGSFALAVAVLTTLDTLLASSVLDGRLRLSRDGNRELQAQALSNMASALVGGQASAPAIGRTLILIDAVPQARNAVRVYALVLLLLLLVIPGAVANLPLTAIGGVLMAQGWLLLDNALWRTPLALLRQRQAVPAPAAPDTTHRRILLENWLVLAAVVAVSLLWGLGQAVLVGALISMTLFVRANARGIVRRASRGDQRQSHKVRQPAATALLRAEGSRIALLELQGSLFFGTADQLREQLRPLQKSAQTVVLDLRHVHDIDSTGARILLELASDAARDGCTLVVSEWPSGDARRQVVEASMAGSALSLEFAATTDEALEGAEDRLLAKLTLTGSDRLTLDQTLLARGLDAAELAVLQAELTQLAVPRGAALFRAGDPGDAIYVSVHGEIGVHLAGSTRRLASFAPGVMVGEMAVLEGQRRSADAVAETDLVVLRLSAEAFERLRAAQPALAAKLLHNISLYLAGRLRGLTAELAAWVGR